MPTFTSERNPSIFPFLSLLHLREEEVKHMDIRSTSGEVTVAPPSGCIPPGVEGRINQVLSEWIALQMAVHNEWGGPDSIQKYNQLLSDIPSWLFHHNVSELEELENLLHVRLLLCFNTEIEDDSTEEVAEQLMIMRDEYLPFGDINK